MSATRSLRQRASAPDLSHDAACGALGKIENLFEHGEPFTCADALNGSEIRCHRSLPTKVHGVIFDLLPCRLKISRSQGEDQQFIAPIDGVFADASSFKEGQHLGPDGAMSFFVSRSSTGLETQHESVALELIGSAGLKNGF